MRKIVKTENKILQTLSDFVQMRFTLKNNCVYLAQREKQLKKVDSLSSSRCEPLQNFSPPKKTHLQKQNTKPIIKPLKSQTKAIQPPSDKSQNNFFKLKYLVRLSQEHLIIGNQYQIDMIKLCGILDGFIDVQYKWSINAPEAIISIAVERKLGLVAMASQHKVYGYRYNLKIEDSQPQPVFSCFHNDPILHIQFVKNTGIYIIMNSKLEFFRLTWVCEKIEANLVLTYNYEISSNMKIQAVPEPFDTTLNIYFYQSKQDSNQSDKFGLWMQSFSVLSSVEIPQVGKLLRIYSIEEEVKEKIQIFNYNKEICFIQFQNKLIAFKNGFVIDAVSTNIHQANCFIKYISSSKYIFHFLDQVIDVYKLNMREKPKPQKFSLECKDCMELTYRQCSSLFDVLYLSDNKYAFFFQNSHSKIKSDHPNITYSFAVTRPVDLYSKISQIYPNTQDIKKFTIEELSQKSKIVRKMGLTKRQAFLQLWKLSGKNSIRDLQILLSTNHFPTIEYQIESKLKRSSMSVREILKIYQQCLNFLHNRVFSDYCKVQDLQQYSSCHFLIRKMEMLRWVLSHESNPQGIILINIKQYKQYKDMSVAFTIVSLVVSYISKKSDQTLLKIKGIFKFFRLICRIHYHQIIEKLIKACKLKFVEILQIIPQLLPLIPENDDKQQIVIGIWGDVTEQQIDENIFLSELKTIDNKDKVEQFAKQLWFKRNLNANHGVITINKIAIKQYIQVQNNYQKVFYAFLCHLYNLHAFDEQLRTLISYIQNNYQLMPIHLSKKLQLYLILFSIFYTLNPGLKLMQFLRLRQHQLFKMYFERQKIEKGGFILKKIKPLYEQLLSEGKQIFNHGMYEYFSSDVSTVSDLKCILNKLNNQKNEFHINSQKLYEVLINAIMQKIRIGADSDTPIDEILVYIENIPFPIHNECIMNNLEYIQQINYESEMLKKIKVNMTLEEIVRQGETVIQLMVDHQIQRHQVNKIREYRCFRLHAYKILAQIQCRKSNIYGDQYHKYSLKIFLISIMSNIEMIPLCKELLADKYLIQQFEVDISFKQSLIMHMYQWRVKKSKSQHQNPYQNHLQYINLLLEFLDPTNNKRRFIQLSNKYAEIFTLAQFKIQQPLFPTFSYYPALVDIQGVFDCLNVKDLIGVKLQKLFQVMFELKKLGQMDENINNSQIKQYQHKLRLQLYEIYLKRLVQERQLKMAMEKVQIMLTIPNQFPQYNIIYPILIIEKIYEQVLKNTSVLLDKLISVYYDSPNQLCRLIKIIYTSKFSNKDLDNMLNSFLKKKCCNLIYSSKNDIIAKQMKQNCQNVNEIQRKNQLMQICLKRMLMQSEDYNKNHNMQIVFRLMCHDCYAVAKWIWCKGTGINIKTLRSFISYMSLELPFDGEAVIRAAIEIMKILQFKCTNNVFFSQILKFKHFIDLESKIQIQDLENKQLKALSLITESILVLQSKIKIISLKNVQTSIKNILTDYINDPKLFEKNQPTKYIYQDDDDAYQKGDDEQLSIKSKWRSKVNSLVENRQQSSQGLSKYEQIPLPTANRKRQRKASAYFPEMIDIVEDVSNFLKTTYSQQNLHSQQPIQSRYPQVDQIPEDVCNENMSSLIMMKGISQQSDAIPYINIYRHDQLIEKNNSSSDNISLVQQVDKSFQHYQIKISLSNSQQHVSIQKITLELLNCINGLFDLTLLKQQAKKVDFKQYLQQLLKHIYHLHDKPFQQRMRLITSIINQYKQQYHMNRDYVKIFEKLMRCNHIENFSFPIQKLLPIDILFNTSLEMIFEHFTKDIMPTINILDASSIETFLGDFIGQKWKIKFMIKVLIQRVIKVRLLKNKINQDNFSDGDMKVQQKALDDFELEQRKVIMIIEDREYLWKELEYVIEHLKSNSHHKERQIGLILARCLGTAKEQNTSQR